jgi:predicted nucleotide-binding protein (sugar kinase/HSP70/actin superfamily)
MRNSSQGSLESIPKATNDGSTPRGSSRGKTTHYRRSPTSPFTAEQRSTTTILAGSITTKHERLIEAVFRGQGYRFQALPSPNNRGFQVGKEFCNNGLCNPYYYTTGNLICHLRDLERQGVSRPQLGDSYLYFAMGGCGPCRFGMYESEYRQALKNAGFDGFRVITFQSDSPVREGSDQPGLQFTADLTLGTVNALLLGDLLYGMAYQIRPYEVRLGETDRALEECVRELADFLRTQPRFELAERLPHWLPRQLREKLSHGKWPNHFGKFSRHFYTKDYAAVLSRCSNRLNQIEVDWIRPKPVVKIVGEFFSQVQESDANYNAFAFLEKEGAEVAVDTTTSLLQYWLYYYQIQCQERKHVDRVFNAPAWWQIQQHLANRFASTRKILLPRLTIRLLAHLFDRTAGLMGGLARPLPDQEDLARLAQPFFDPRVEGGEGHMEVAKSIYYTTNHSCHMILSLKPFGCMPSTQSDGVMAKVASRFPHMLFQSIETSGEGEVNAHSRMQMALGEAHRKARAEFDHALRSTGKTLEQIQAFVSRHRDLRRPFYRFPRRAGMAGTAANFIQHVSDLMDHRVELREGR